MTFAHVMGMPVEESALTLAPAGAAILTGAAVIARSKLAEIVGWLRRRCDREGDRVRSTPLVRAATEIDLSLSTSEERSDAHPSDRCNHPA